MSVIAKLSVRSVRDFGSGRLVTLGCVCANDLMVAYAGGSEEDKLFTKYSPWGEMSLHQPNGFCLGKEGDVFYAMLMRTAELPEDALRSHQLGSGPYAVSTARIASVTDFGDNSAKTVEMCNGHRKPENRKVWGVDNFNWRMSVDNPLATNQLTPGVDDYWLLLYPAEHFDRDQTIAAAHGRD